MSTSTTWHNGKTLEGNVNKQEKKKYSMLSMYVKITMESISTLIKKYFKFIFFPFFCNNFYRNNAIALKQAQIIWISNINSIGNFFCFNIVFKRWRSCCCSFVGWNAFSILIPFQGEALLRLLVVLKRCNTNRMWMKEVHFIIEEI